MTLTAAVYAINFLLLIIALVLAILITRAGARHMLNYGDIAVQDPLKFRILKLLMALLGLGIIAALLNLFVATF